MKWTSLLAITAITLAAAACGKTANSAVCCLDPADCASIGVDEEVRSCAAGEACIDNACVTESCEAQGCEPAAPVCNVVTDACEGCNDSADCSGFASENVCDPTTGACVQCLSSTDCAAATPICQANTCRKCNTSFECASGACGDDGACVPESEIVYLDPAGVDSGDCVSAAACRTLAYGVTQTTAMRSHIVMRKGAYTMPEDTVVTTQSTTAARLFVHGTGSSLTEATGEFTVMRASIPITIRDLEIYGAAGLEVGSTGGPSLLERVIVRGGTYALALDAGTTTLRDVIVYGTGSKQVGITVHPNATLHFERGIISDFDTCVDVPPTTFPQINMTNVLVHTCRSRALDLEYSRGLIEFTTIANSGGDTGTGPRAVACGTEMTFRASIVWAPGTASRAPISGCNIVTSIAGPTPVAGALSSDPRFFDNTSNFHLRPESPARDLVDMGPNSDMEGQPRPQGPRFDIGAFEAAP